MTAAGDGRWDAIVLTGGASRRMDGVAKPTLPVDGRSLLDRVVAALGDGRRVVVVGPRTAVTGVVLWTREDPPGGGPALALAAGVAVVDAPYVAVLAADLPFLTPAAVSQLRRAADPATVAVAVDDRGRDQYLLAVWPTAVLRSTLAAAGPLPGRSLRAVYQGVSARRVALAGVPPPWWDCDTPEQLAQARAWAEDPSSRVEPMTLDEWMTTAAESLDVPISALGDVPGLRAALLDVARDAAHGVARPAAPLTTFLLGVAVGRGMSVDDAAAAIRRVLPAPPPDERS